MKGLGSGDEGEFTFMDTISLISFMIGLQNLDINVSQTDLQEETKRLDAKVDEKVQLALDEIHKHLKDQDHRLNLIIERLEERNDS